MWRRKTRSSPSVLEMIEGAGPCIFPVHCDNSGDHILLLTSDCSALLWLLSRRASLEHWQLSTRFLWVPLKSVHSALYTPLCTVDHRNTGRLSDFFYPRGHIRDGDRDLGSMVGWRIEMVELHNIETEDGTSRHFREIWWSPPANTHIGVYSATKSLFCPGPSWPQEAPPLFKAKFPPQIPLK